MTILTHPKIDAAAELENLRVAAWPSERPAVNPFMHGWFHGETVLPHFVKRDAKLIVELGSWLGKSARWFLRYCPNATVVCIDHWQGSLEMRPRWDWLVPRLYETFLHNLWDYRERVVPLRMESAEGVRLLKEIGVKPDLAFVDAGHDEQNVKRDVEACLDAFPDSQIVGDDWNWQSVQRGLGAVSGLSYQHDDWRFWWTV